MRRYDDKIKTAQDDREKLENSVVLLKEEATRILTEEQMDVVLGTKLKKELDETKADYKKSLNERRKISKVKNLKITKNAALVILPIIFVAISNVTVGTFIIDKSDKKYEYVSQISTNSGESFETSSYDVMDDFSVTVIESKDHIQKIHVINSDKIDLENKEEILRGTSYEDLVQKELLPKKPLEISYSTNTAIEDGTIISFSQNTRNKDNYIFTSSEEEKKSLKKTVLPITFSLSLVWYGILELISKKEHESNIYDRISTVIQCTKEKRREIKDLNVKEKRKTYKNKERIYKKRGK